MYWFLFLIFRVVLRRDVGAVGVADVLLVVLVADASQNAMTGGYTSVAEGAMLVATLIGWNLLLDWIDGLPLSLGLPPGGAAAAAADPGGRVLHKNLRSEMITVAELRGQLRQHGLESFDEVKAAWYESDGQFSFIKRNGESSDAAVKRPKVPIGRVADSRDKIAMPTRSRA